MGREGDLYIALFLSLSHLCIHPCWDMAALFGPFFLHHPGISQPLESYSVVIRSYVNSVSCSDADPSCDSVSLILFAARGHSGFVMVVTRKQPGIGNAHSYRESISASTGSVGHQPQQSLLTRSAYILSQQLQSLPKDRH